MIGALMRAAFYLSVLTLMGLVAWTYYTARTWQEVAAAADQTQAKAAKIAKDAVERADRCVGELYKVERQEKAAVKTPSAAPKR